MTGMNIRRFGEEDIDFALAQTSREGWDNTAAIFRVCLAHDPEGCFIAEVEGRRVGMVTTTSYAQSGWVGNLIVLPEHRRRGIGERLMRHAIAHLERCGIRTMRLEADPMGIALYRRLGFVDQFDSLRFRKDPPQAPQGARGTARKTIDLARVKMLDRNGFGDDRGRLLELLRGSAYHTHEAQSGEAVYGFAMALPSAAGVRFGPCIAESDEAAKTLLDAVLANCPSETIVVGVPSVNQIAIELLDSRGFKRLAPCLRMIRGEARADIDADRLFAIANGGTG